MQFLTTTLVLILGVIAVIASWIIAVRVINSDKASAMFISPSATNDATCQNELTTVHAN